MIMQAIKGIGMAWNEEILLSLPLLVDLIKFAIRLLTIIIIITRSITMLQVTIPALINVQAAICNSVGTLLHSSRYRSTRSFNLNDQTATEFNHSHELQAEAQNFGLDVDTFSSGNNGQNRGLKNEASKPKLQIIKTIDQ